MKNTMATLLVTALLASVTPSMAQQAPQPQPQPAGGVQADGAGFAEGEVRKVDKSAGKITLRHGEIRNLDMPPMTMVFGVRDASLLDQVKAGDKVRFRAATEGGKFTVTEIQALR